MSPTVKLLLSVMLVIEVVHGSHNFWNQYIDTRASQVISINPNTMDSCNQRQAPGFICMDCRVLARCVFRNNGWDTIPLEICDEGQNLFCHASEQRCSSSPGPCNPGGGSGGAGFPCSSEGVFPDPFNCQMYHMCFASGMNLVSVNILCGGNFAFNPLTNDCSLNTNHALCRGSQFTCNNVGDMGPWPVNPNIYYICMATTGPNGLCGDSNGINGNAFECQRAGLFPDPYDCQAYFHCDGLLRSQRIMCPLGTYFNQLTLGCIRGNCR